MGKKSKNNAKQNTIGLPFVSICTPTFNRRPFIPYIIKCFNNQTYPKDKMEWIIIDDGTDKIEDLVAHVPQAKYFKYDQKMSLGKKRNIMHEKSKGDIIVYTILRNDTLTCSKNHLAHQGTENSLVRTGLYLLVITILSP